MRSAAARHHDGETFCTARNVVAFAATPNVSPWLLPQLSPPSPRGERNSTHKSSPVLHNNHEPRSKAAKRANVSIVKTFQMISCRPAGILKTIQNITLRLLYRRLGWTTIPEFPANRGQRVRGDHIESQPHSSGRPDFYTYS